MIVLDTDQLKIDAVIWPSDDSKGTEYVQISQFMFDKNSGEWRTKVTRIPLDVFVRITDKLIIPYSSLAETSKQDRSHKQDAKT